MTGPGLRGKSLFFRAPKQTLHHFWVVFMLRSKQTLHDFLLFCAPSTPASPNPGLRTVFLVLRPGLGDGGGERGAKQQKVMEGLLRSAKSTQKNGGFAPELEKPPFGSPGGAFSDPSILLKTLTFPLGLEIGLVETCWPRTARKQSVVSHSEAQPPSLLGLFHALDQTLHDLPRTARKQSVF